ncbi:MAG: hypothetical protein ABR902_17390 [Candidatus Korobacteraceae bacterium]
MYNLVALIVSVASACVAVAAWWTRRQMLRLELYKRRFDIYSRVLDFAGVLLEWNPTESETASQGLRKSPELLRTFEAFLKAGIEARFLFDKDSGIKQALDQMTRTASQIIGYKWHAPESRVYLSSTEVPDEHLTFQENHKRFFDSIPPLEEAMSKYLNFHML